MNHPGCTYHGVYAPGTDRFDQFRSDKIGGSEIGCILGVGFKSAYWLHFHKLGLMPAEPENAQMEWGRRLEPSVIAKFEDEHPELRVWTTGASYTRKRRPWQLATPDAWLNSDHTDRAGVLEAKTAKYPDSWGPSGSEARGNVPLTYFCQLLWTCDTVGARWGWLAVLIGHDDYREYHLDLNTDLDADRDAALLVKDARRWRRDLLNGVRPEPGDGSESTYEAVRYLHPDIDRGTRGEIDQEVASEYTLAVIEEEKAIKRRRAAAAVVMEQAGRAHQLHAVDQDGVVDLQRFAFRTSRRQRDGSDGTPYVQMDKTIKDAMSKINTIQEAVQ